jgi:hypothetical protein
LKKTSGQGLWGAVPLFIVLLLCLGAGSFAEVDPFVGFYDARENAIGGRHAALVDGFSSMLSNPASLAASKPSFSAGRLDLGIAGPIFDMANLILDDPNDLLSGVKNLLTSYNYKVNAAVDLSGPISLGYRGDGLGFGIFQRTHIGADVASLDSVSMTASEDILIAGGYGFRINLGNENALDIGLLAKGFVRGSIVLDGGVVELYGLVDNPLSFFSNPFYLTTGVGLDAGLRWNWAEIISFGVACRDAYSPVQISQYSSALDFSENPSTSYVSTESALLDPDLSAGFAFKPPLGFFSRVFDGLVIAVDYDDILDLLSALPRNPILNVDAGLEVKFLDVFTLRIGVREALLQAGIDLNLDFAHIVVSAWGDELGIEPGERSVYNLLIGIDFIY